MNCVEMTPLISAYADGELDLFRSHSVKKHILNCAACTATYENVKSLGVKLRAQAPYFAASPSLLARVRATLQNTPAEGSPLRSHPTGNRSRWFVGGALAGCAATVLVWMLGSAARRGETAARRIVWGLFVLQIIGLGLSLRYFSVGPAALSGVAAFCLAMAGLAVRRPVSFTGGHSKHSTKSSFETA